MYFELGQALHLQIDCVGDIGPDQGAIFGWVRHPAGETPLLHVAGGVGLRLPTVLLVLHPRTEVELPDGMAVSGFTLLHDIPPGAAGRLLVIGLGGQEIALDLMAYDLPGDPAAATIARDPGATFQFLHAAARDPARIRAVPAGLFNGWLDHLPRRTGSTGAFLDFSQLSVVCTAEGEVAVSGSFGMPGAAGERTEAMACAMLRPGDGPARIVPLHHEGFAPLETGFVLRGQIEPSLGAQVELVVQLQRGDHGWWFRGEAEAVALPGLLATLTLAGTELPGADAGALHGWLKEALRHRGEVLRAGLCGIGQGGGRAAPGGTALIFDLHDDYAARVLSLLAPQLETQFGRIVIAGAAATRAAAALLHRGRMEVAVEEDAEAALALAARGVGFVTPIDTPALVDAAIEGNLTRLAGHALGADHLAKLETLHVVAGMDGMEGTLRRLMAIMEGRDLGGVHLPGQRPDPIGGLVAEHLRMVWDMVAGREARP
ncbi:hypothetical protein [Roseomonas xinghualingensis]|uniref:hypothetical protein n=1 Tax=Roseomonas xinghualingensis TaxID=2986475 RepID=UPI0021F1090D|nr:hypothetical protein [Roseomonas sp. SXEYE001]MCV4208664.1 hypothetical protein [Roseomonas sp. SXEYE001]